MTILNTIILSVVEGITEFLPISSTGHLILTSYLLGIEQTEFVKSFEIIIQLGAILAVVMLYAKKILATPKVLLRIFTAFIPTAVIGLVLYKLIKEVLLGNIWVTLSALCIGGIILIAIEYLFPKRLEGGEDNIEKISLGKAFSIGVAQSLAVIPGVSRSAATIIGGSLLGLSRQAAVEFSFLLAVPTMAAATGLDILKTNIAFTSQEYMLLAIGFVGSFVTAIIAIKFFMKYIKTHTFIGFGIYRIIIAVVMALILLR